MKINGTDFIEAICNRLKKRYAYLTDSNIRIEIEKLSWVELNKIVLLGKDTKYIPPKENE